MSVPSPAPVSVVASLLRVAALPLPARSPPDHAGGVADRVTLSAAPPGVAALWDMASAGLRSLGALLPVLVRAMADPSASPEEHGHLAQAVGMAAHQAGTGFVAVLHSADPARPGAAVLEEWRGQASRTLDTAAGTLAQAAQLMAAGPARAGVPWALGQIAAARREVGTAQANLRHGHAPAVPVPARTAGRWGWPLTLLMAVLGALAALLWAGAGELALAAAALGTWGVWVARVALPRRRLRLGHPRQGHCV